MKVSVVYASTVEHIELLVDVSDDCLVEQAIILSGILGRFPEIDLAINAVGIFSDKVTLDAPLHEGDRIEIYRPLIIDPKDARRLRANKRAKKD